MAHRKGDRISFTHPKTKALAHGVVTKVGTRISIITDDLESLVGGAAAFTPSSQPIPPKLRDYLNGSKLEKGDRVEFTSEGATVYGVVRKGGTSVVVVHDGAKFETRGPATLFTKSSHPLPTDPPSEMDKWGVTGYREHASLSDETPCFEATITFEGKPVLAASNRGHGGPNSYHPHPKAPKGTNWSAALRDAVASWEKQFGSAYPGYDPVDDWLSWHVTKRPYGITATAHFEDWNARMARLKKEG